MSMGFERDKVVHALKACGNDQEEALEYLLNANVCYCVGKFILFNENQGIDLKFTICPVTEKISE